ncbi:MAG: ribose 5-phosphate isomerase B [Clostridiales bacterium]|nr:ribose 5-phosphate isomerase B [Clostridiales bacterium]
MIYVACDHGGLELKKAIIDKLTSDGVKVCDLGTNSTDSVDYPDFGIAVAEKVAENPSDKGIVICKTGVGMSIAANKVKGVRCALCTSKAMGHLCREHNNANVLALGASNTDIATALEIVGEFISTEFAGGRHANRVNKITSYEEKHG